MLIRQGYKGPLRKIGGTSRAHTSTTLQSSDLPLPADAATKVQVAGTADELIKAGVQNILKARQRMDILPQLPGWHNNEYSVANMLDPVMAPGYKVNSLESRKLMRDCINALYVSESRTEHAARSANCPRLVTE